MPVSLHASDTSTAGEPEVHTIDPNGDVVLTLTRYVRFEDEVVPEPDSAERTLEARISPFCAPAKPAELAETSWHTEEGEEGEKANDGRRQPVSRRQSASSSAAIDSSADSSFCLEEVIIRASSRHLTFASPVFRAMLERKFSESNTLRMTGSVEIPLPGDDPDALLIVLNAVHGRFRAIPLTVDLETLTQIAVLVDKYDLLEPVELLADFWFDNLKPNIPEVYTDDIPSWICICWVLNKPTEFERTTRIAMRRGRGNLPAAGLPIPQPVIDALNTRRTECLGYIVDTLHENLSDYMKREHCSFECDALMLGCLTKRLLTLKILPERPEMPYDGLCFEDFNYRFRQGMYFPGAQRTSTFYYAHSKCAIRSIEQMLTKWDERLCGLTIETCRAQS